MLYVGYVSCADYGHNRHFLDTAAHITEKMILVPNAPYFYFTSEAVDFLVDLQVKNIVSKHENVFTQDHQIDRLKDIIKQDWSDLLECSLISFDIKSIAYFHSHWVSTVKQLSDYGSTSVYGLSNNEILTIKRLSLRLSKISMLLRFIVRTNEAVHKNYSEAISRARHSITICENEIRRRMILKPFPFLAAALIAYPSAGEIGNFMLLVAEKATMGLAMPGDEVAKYKKVGSGTETESLLNELIVDSNLKAWMKVIKDGELDNAFLGEVSDIAYIPNAVRMDFINKLDSLIKKRENMPEVSLDVPIAEDSEYTFKDVLIDDSCSEDDLMHILEIRELVPQCLNLINNPGVLTDRQRQVLKLRIIENKTLEEAGKELGIASQNVHKTKKAAVKKIRNHIFSSKSD